MIRTPRSAALAVLAAAALVSVPGTAFADASDLGPGPGFNNGIIVNHVYQYAGGDIFNSDDDGVVGNPPGGVAPFAQFRIENRSATPLERTSQEGAEYPPFLFPQSIALLQTGDPSSADYRSVGSAGTVHIDATVANNPTCNGGGSLQCQIEYGPAGVSLVITGG